MFETGDDEENWTQVYLHNQWDSDLTVFLRPLRSEVEIDCDAVALDPGALLPESAYGPAIVELLAPRGAINPWTQWAPRECYAVLVTANSFPPFVMFWDSSLPQQPLPQEVEDSWLLPDFGVRIATNASGLSGEIYDTGASLSFVPSANATQPEEGCEFANLGARVDWFDMPAGGYEIDAVEYGAQGCLELTMTNISSGLPRSSTLCMPFVLFPFESGEHIDITLEDTTLILAERDATIAKMRTLRLDRASKSPDLEFFHIQFRKREGCGYSVDLGCVGTARPADVLVVGELDNTLVQLGGGTTSFFQADGRVAHMQLTYAAEQIAIDPTGQSGDDHLGVNVDLVTLTEAAP